jgi:hypothetical protein
MIIKMKSNYEGDHVHARIFSGDHRGQLPHNGELVFKIDEWLKFSTALLIGAHLMNDLTVESEGLVPSDDLLRRLTAENCNSNQTASPDMDHISLAPRRLGALDAIVEIMSGKEWSADTCSEIAEILSAAGYDIQEPS